MPNNIASRAHCDNTFQGLEQNIEQALDSVNVEIIRKYLRKVRDYHRAYRNNRYRSADNFKKYKSHRRVTEVEDL